MSDRVPDKPKRRVQFTLHLMADTEAECSRMLEEIALEFDQGMLHSTFASGGVSSGFWGETIIRDDITPEGYQKALAAYMEMIDGHKARPAS